ncbi:hypothetical protein [Actinomadura sp. 6N118]|uniref:hypothetical protein n=1 Tax=Actinomadura sp. 6N118 TaxID=3375151 RepID=UPI0037AF5427
MALDSRSLTCSLFQHRELGAGLVPSGPQDAGSADTLRHHFIRHLGTTPHAYRRTFRGRQPALDGAP